VCVEFFLRHDEIPPIELPNFLVANPSQRLLTVSQDKQKIFIAPFSLQNSNFTILPVGAWGFIAIYPMPNNSKDDRINSTSPRIHHDHQPKTNSNRPLFSKLMLDNRR
jgi:hypothetical protein